MKDEMIKPRDLRAKATRMAQKPKAKRDALIAAAIAECERTGNSPESIKRLNRVSPHHYFVPELNRRGT